MACLPKKNFSWLVYLKKNFFGTQKKIWMRSPILFSYEPHFATCFGQENCILSLFLNVNLSWCFEKGLACRKAAFQVIFDIHFSLWTFGGSTGKVFFGFAEGFAPLLTQKKLFLSHHQMSYRKSSCQKKSWKVAFLQARPFSRPKKSLHPSIFYPS